MLKVTYRGPITPHAHCSFKQRIRFALCGFHSLLLTASRLISFPPGTETFHFPGLLLLSEWLCEVAFGNLWFVGYLHLARAYRSLSRPSSCIEPSYPPYSVVGSVYCYFIERSLNIIVYNIGIVLLGSRNMKMMSRTFVNKYCLVKGSYSLPHPDSRELERFGSHVICMSMKMDSSGLSTNS